MIALMVALGAAVGAPARYLTDVGVRRRCPGAFPWGTLTVNVVASLVLGFVAGRAAHVSAEVEALVGTGFCGALSTFSTFSYETLRLLAPDDDGAGRSARLRALSSVLGSVGAGLLAVTIGWSLGR